MRLDTLSTAALHHRTRRTLAALTAALRAADADRPPDYRSPAWHALPAGHPHRHAALVIAADAWHHYWTREAITARLRADLDEHDRITADIVKGISQDLAGATDWTAVGPSHQDLQRRRYPWLHDPAWRCAHGHRHADCAACATPAGTPEWRTAA